MNRRDENVNARLRIADHPARQHGSALLTKPAVAA